MYNCFEILTLKYLGSLSFLISLHINNCILKLHTWYSVLKSSTSWLENMNPIHASICSHIHIWYIYCLLNPSLSLSLSFNLIKKQYDIKYYWLNLLTQCNFFHDNGDERNIHSSCITILYTSIRYLLQSRGR